MTFVQWDGIGQNIREECGIKCPDSGTLISSILSRDRYITTASGVRRLVKVGDWVIHDHGKPFIDLGYLPVYNIVDKWDK